MDIDGEVWLLSQLRTEFHLRTLSQMAVISNSSITKLMVKIWISSATLHPWVYDNSRLIIWNILKHIIQSSYRILNLRAAPLKCKKMYGNISPSNSFFMIFYFSMSPLLSSQFIYQACLTMLWLIPLINTSAVIGF